MQTKELKNSLIGICIWAYMIFISIPVAEGQWINKGIFTPSDTFRMDRFLSLAVGTGLAYSGVVYALDKAWYAQQPRGRFRFFNDWKEWNQMDKMGHAMTGYYENAISYRAARWTGMNHRNALITGATVATALQLTIEIMDGFVTTYGFSWTDLAFNTIGIGVFTAQEAYWHDQPFMLKFSAGVQTYPEHPILSSDMQGTSSLQQRANELYGHTFFERLLKDYNGQTYWLSFFPGHFLKSKQSGWPRWLGCSLGYSAENMFGGISNSWQGKDGLQYAAPDAYGQRYRQFLFSLDIDLTKIKVRSPFLKTVFRTLNFIKIPFPALEYNTFGQWRRHWLYF